MAQTINADDGVISGSAGLKWASDGTAILSLQTKGTTALTVDGGQKVGIGTASPAVKLDVGYVDGNVALRVTRDSSNRLDFYQGGGISYIDSSPASGQIALATAGTERVRLDTSGNLGVGTTSPGYKLDVRGVTASGNGTITTGFTYDTRGLVGTFSNHALGFITNGASPTMVLDTSGNLGVGTTSPGGRLDVAKSGPCTIYNKETSASVTSKWVSSDGGLSFFGTESNHASAFITNDTERARITSGGNLLVGTTSSSAVADPGVKIIPEFNGANSPGLSIVTSPSSNSTSSILLYSTGAGAYRFYVGDGGTIYATNTTISAISDQRFKENISDLDIGLDAVMALKPRKFDWKAGKGKDIKNDRGFIAQEFEQVFPDLIDEWKDPAPEGEESYKSVRQDLIPVLVKAIQEQQAMIKALEAKVAALESK